jgi:pimeloyl-ACP methyl ester carboxylesterase
LFKTHDVALIVLPGHGARSLPAYSPLPSFPSRNPIRNLLGLLTAVTETRQLIQWLRSRGYTELGVAGSSLGVQVVALLATVEPCAERYLFDRPLAELKDPLRRRARTETAEMTTLLDALVDFYRPVSPLCRPSRVAPHQVDVLLGREDRVAGLQEGEAFAKHFGVVAKTFPTGHVLSMGREAVVVELMRKLGNS